MVSRTVLIAIAVVVTLISAGIFAWTNETIWSRITALLPGTSRLQPSGPIVEMPAGIVFIGTSYEAANVGIVAAPTPQALARAQQRAAEQPRDAHALNDAATLLGESGLHEPAIQMFEAAQRVAPDDPTIAFNYGRELYRQGRVDDAIAQADKAIALKPDFDEARLLRADGAIAKKDYATAETQLERVLKQVEVATLVTRGVVLLAKGQTQEGMQDFQRALQIAQGMQRGIPEYNLGVGSQQLGDLTQAEQHYKNATAANPSLAEAHNNLGTLLMRAGNSSGAFEEFHAASVLKPNDQTFSSHLSDASLRSASREDDIIGDWQIQGGTVTLSGTIGGQPGSQSGALPAGQKVSFTKASDGGYQLTAAVQGIQLSTTFHRQPSGAYSGPTASTGQLGIQLPPGVTENGTITFWVGGDTLFGDTVSTATGPNASLHLAVTWKAVRSR